MLKVAAPAIERGLGFLEAAVGPDGSWPSRRYGNHELTGTFALDRPPAPFVAALGALSLGACDHPRARALAARSRRYIHSRVEYPGVWRYWPTIPPDQDDTAMCSLAAPAHIWLLAGNNLGVILSYRDDEGRFLTWMTPRETSQEVRNDVDSVVNANVVAHLGDIPETAPAQRWLESLIEERREVDSSPWYLYPMDLYAALARASRLAAPAFRRLRPTLIERILECRDGDGDFGDPRRTALAVSVLASLGRRAGPEVIRPSLERLLEAQGPNGGWPECLAWNGPVIRTTSGDTRHIGFASETLTTACCIEALARCLRDR